MDISSATARLAPDTLKPQVTLSDATIIKSGKKSISQDNQQADLLYASQRSFWQQKKDVQGVSF